MFLRAFKVKQEIYGSICGTYLGMYLWNKKGKENIRLLHEKDKKHFIRTLDHLQTVLLSQVILSFSYLSSAWIAEQVRTVTTKTVTSKTSVREFKFHVR